MMTSVCRCGDEAVGNGGVLHITLQDAFGEMEWRGLTSHFKVTFPLTQRIKVKRPVILLQLAVGEKLRVLVPLNFAVCGDGGKCFLR